MPISLPSGPRSTKRKPPPTLKSTSHTTSDQPRGPNQRLSSSGLEKASKTRRRGASKTRLITTSRSVGVVTFKVPVLFIAALLGRAWRVHVFLFSCLVSSTHPADRRDAGNFLPRTGGTFQANCWRRRAVLPRFGAAGAAHR